MFDNRDVISRYTVQQGIADELLVAVDEEIWPVLTGGKPLVATRAVWSEFSVGVLRAIWQEYVVWRKTVQPTLPPDEDLFATTVQHKTVWVLEDGEAFTILFPDDY